MNCRAVLVGLGPVLAFPEPPGARNDKETMSKDNVTHNIIISDTEIEDMN